MSLAVVGTGTDVGKTVISALVLARYAGPRPLAYWKPLATGAGGDAGPERLPTDSETVARLAPPEVEILAERYLFAPPVSPHLAARLAGTVIDPAAVLAAFAAHRAARPERALVVEGVGGLLVPLNENALLIDLLAAAGLPCLLVAKSGLGTINHTLLSLEALRGRGIAVLGVVMNGPPDAENRAAIERFGGVPVIAEVAPIEPLASFDRAAVARAAGDFDPTARLAEHLERA